MADRVIPSGVWTAYRAQVREVVTLERELGKSPADAHLEAELSSAIKALDRLDRLVAGVVGQGSNGKRRR